MADSTLWVGVLTAATALGASLGTSLLTSRGNEKVARQQALVNARATHLTEARNRRREAYRELIARAHELSRILWRMEEVDRATDTNEARALLREVQTASRPALNDVEKCVRDVLLEGPPSVSESAGKLNTVAIETRYYLCELTDRDGHYRDRYESSYKAYEDQYLLFIELARHALEVPDAL
ncbi:hypothetical protein PZB75_11675 [Streptomyces sp. AM 4-1-1]|uniref:hypothetical protein n=1 Tax=Streptomyces sp. AM 4-1-1 TaxID=3028710 RepID=UPI0023B8CE3A|nr:hypothetical protein [Streptomyces sp. AM 4-1-1]WEH33971.1 hypothetical protein PZB75_11675 [Streptomyces sp. AM 4-1-1]